MTKKKKVIPATRKASKSNASALAKFDPSSVSAEVLARHSIDELFEIANRERATQLRSDGNSQSALTAASRWLPQETVESLKSSSMLQSGVPVIIYARYSSEMQNPLSIADQVALCRRYCETKGYRVVMVCSDAAKTGQTTADRDGWEKAERGIENGIAAIIVSESLDRVARDTLDLLMIVEKMRRCGAVIDTPSTGHASPLQALIQGIYNFIFKSNLVDKVRRGMGGAVGRGRHPGGTNYGLRKVRGKTEELDKYVPDKKQVKIYFRIMYEIGVLQMGYWEIAHGLNRDRIPSPKGSVWTPQNFVHGNDLGGLAINSRCIGVIQWNKASYEKVNGTVTVKKNPRSEWVIGYNKEQAFIPIWLWDLVQQEVASRRLGPSGPRLATPRRFLTNLLKCGTCGRGMHILAADKDGRPRVGCSTVKASGDCNNRRSFYLDTIEQMTAHEIASFVSSPKKVQISFDGAVQEIKQQRKDLKSELKDLREAKTALSPMTKELVKKMANARVDTDLLRKIIANDLSPIYSEVEKIERRMREIELLLASDQLNPSKIKAMDGVFGNLEKLLQKTGGKDLPRPLIDAAQSIIGKVVIVPKADRHFELKIFGKFDGMISDDYRDSVATIDSKNYKNAQKEGPPHPTKLTIAGKPFVLSVSSEEAGVAVSEEIHVRRIGRPSYVPYRRTAVRLQKQRALQASTSNENLSGSPMRARR